MRFGRFAIGMGASGLAGAMLAGGVVYAWQRAEVRDRERALQGIQEQQSQMGSRLDRALDLIGSTKDELGDLGRRTRRMRAALRRKTVQLDVVRRSLRAEMEARDDSLEDGRYFGYLSAVSARPPHVVVDLALWFSGREATRAAIEDGEIKPGDSVPNDYYVRNESELLRRVLVTPEAEVVLFTWDPRNIPTEKMSALAELGRIFTAPKEWELSVTNSGYWLTVQAGVVVSLEEQYVP